MRYLLCFFILIMPVAVMSAEPATSSAHPIAIVIHGGAGTITRKDMTPAMEAEYRAGLKQALDAGYAVLKSGGASLDAVQAAIRVMEDNPLFNAGKGAVFAHNGKNEMDAAIMDGASLKAGAVAAVEHIKNPIDLARLVMDKTPHVLLMGEGAEEFARSQGMAMMPASYFFTQHRWDELQKALKAEKTGGPSASAERYPGTTAHGFGTVGAVALDQHGDLAAGTSTGGLTNKYYGRVGDSPIIGAGTYANDATCGVSGTGTGEYFMRLDLSKTISDLMLYKGMPLQQAADQLVMHDLVQLGGKDTGGAIAMDRQGNIAMPFNTEGMYRAYIDTAGHEVVKIYQDE
ncbi:MAG TPA: isoaspartyl peptidase/L-asparaginase [Gammaproteobacteria bacterium]|jgi:beta-aspartyl-peptidase (threonine type)|nr:isoaspartyl peptidase/L-asparaginase [Gammaproteobacteria bacterium]